jgi:integrase
VVSKVVSKPEIGMATRAVRWTDEKVKAVRPPAGKTEVRKLVAPGLYIFARMGKGKVNHQWQYRAQVDGKRRWLSLGSYPEVGLAQANAEMQTHQDAHQAALKGQADHPVVAAQMQRQAIKELPTIQEAFDEWIADKRLGSPRKDGKPVRESTVKILQYNYDMDIKAAIGHAKVKSITTEALRNCVDAPRRRGSPGAAAHVFRTLRGLMIFCVARGYITGADPMRGVVNPKPYRPAPPNAANDVELVAFFKAFEGSEAAPAVKLAAELQIYTGARPGEVRHCTWSHVDLKNRQWVIPDEIDKMGRGFIVHLSAGAMRVFEQAKALKTASDLVFPAPMSVDGKKVIGSAVIGHALNRFKQQTTDENFRRMTPHDLRKTFKTMMSRIGIAPHISEKCLNHKEKNILKLVYDGFDYREQMIEAWDRAGAHLDSLRQGGALVIPIRPRSVA